MSFGELLAAVGEWIWELWPFRIVTQWQQGIRTTGGHIRRTLEYDNGLFGTGVHWFVPLIGDLERLDVKTRVNELANQTFTLRGGASVTIAATARWRIRDLAALFDKVDDPENSVLEAIRSTIGAEAVKREKAEELVSEEFRDDVAKAARREMHGWGVDLVGVGITTLVEAQTLRLIVDEIAGAEE